MRPAARAAVVAAGLLAAAPACDDNPFIAGSFAVDGRWLGSGLAGTGSDTVRFTFDLVLSQDRNNISGSGEISTPTATFPVLVDGNWEYPSVDLVLRAEGMAPLTMDGGFDVDTVPRPFPATDSSLVIRSDTINGIMSGSALDGLLVQLGRAPTGS